MFNDFPHQFVCVTAYSPIYSSFLPQPQKLYVLFILLVDTDCPELEMSAQLPVIGEDKFLVVDTADERILARVLLDTESDGTIIDCDGCVIVKYLDLTSH